VTIKVDLDTLEVLVRLMDQEWDLSILMMEIYTLSPLGDITFDTACKHVNRSQECHITEQVKSACR
jgi:hypothetical protein